MSRRILEKVPLFYIDPNPQKKMQKSFQTPLHTPEDSAIMCGVLHGKGGRKSNQANQGEDDHEDESECRER